MSNRARKDLPEMLLFSDTIPEAVFLNANFVTLVVKVCDRIAAFLKMLGIL